MMLKDVYSSLNLESVAVIVLAVLSLVQIAPIQINPWLFLFRTVGRALNGDVIKQIHCLKKQVEEVQAAQESGSEEWKRYEITVLRQAILRFNDELLNGVKHSKELYDMTLDDITIYENYCDSHPHFVNNKAHMAIENIKRCYEKRLREQSFL